MSILSGIKSLLLGRKSIGVNISPTGRGDSGEIVTESSVMALSAVWGCVNLLAGTGSTLPLNVFTDKDGERKQAKDHPLYRVLHTSPNYDQTAVDFWQSVWVSLELWGNAYARIERSGGKIIALHPVTPSAMSVRRLTSGAIEYSWSESGKSYRLTDVDVFHVRGFGGNPLGGMSTLQFGRNAFGLARAIDRSAGETFANGLRPSGVLTFEKFLSADNREIAEKQLVEKFAGAGNTGP